MSIMTRVETLLSVKDSSLARDAFIVLAASALIGLCAKIAVPLPFTPVPLAVQAQVCLLLGALLGSKRGSLAVLFFLVQGSFGLPVFATGAANMAWVIGPRGGYLLGYLFGTFLTGYLVERIKGEKTAKQMFSCMALGNLVIFVLGWLQLSAFLGMGTALLLGVLPFLLGDALKLLASTRVLKSLRVCR